MDSRFRLLALTCIAIVVALFSTPKDSDGGHDDDLKFLSEVYLCAVGKMKIDSLAVRLAGGANVDSQTEDGTSGMILAAQYGSQEVTGFLIESGADLNLAKNNGDTPLTIASFEGHTEIVSLLLANGAEVNVVPDDGNGALMLASLMGHLDVVKALLTNGADVNAKEKTMGATALMWASSEGHLEVVKALLSAGADMSIENRDGDNAMSLAILGSPDVFAFLLDAGSPTASRLQKHIDSALEEVPETTAQEPKANGDMRLASVRDADVVMVVLKRARYEQEYGRTVYVVDSSGVGVPKDQAKGVFIRGRYEVLNRGDKSKEPGWPRLFLQNGVELDKIPTEFHPDTLEFDVLIDEAFADSTLILKFNLGEVLFVPNEVP